MGTKKAISTEWQSSGISALLEGAIVNIFFFEFLQFFISI